MTILPRKRQRIDSPPLTLAYQDDIRAVHGDAFLRRVTLVPQSLLDLSVVEELVAMDCAEGIASDGDCFSRRMACVFLEQVRDALVQLHHVLYDRGDRIADVLDARTLLEYSLLCGSPRAKLAVPVFTSSADTDAQTEPPILPTTTPVPPLLIALGFGRRRAAGGPVTSCMDLSPLCLRHRRACQLAQFIKASSTSMGAHALWSTFLKMEAISGGMTLRTVRVQTTGTGNGRNEYRPGECGLNWMRKAPSVWPSLLWRSEGGFLPEQGEEDYDNAFRPPIRDLTQYCTALCPCAGQHASSTSVDAIPVITHDRVLSVPYLRALEEAVGCCCDFAVDLGSPLEGTRDNDNQDSEGTPTIDNKDAAIERITAALRVLLHTAYHQFLATVQAFGELYNWTLPDPAPVSTADSRLIDRLIFYEPSVRVPLTPPPQSPEADDECSSAHSPA
ncbi:hypothetical protein RI367_001384 [Sorochytrium milnesiophthora]